VDDIYIKVEKGLLRSSFNESHFEVLSNNRKSIAKDALTSYWIIEVMRCIPFVGLARPTLVSLRHDKESRALDRAAACTALDSVTPRIPQPALGSFVRVDPIPEFEVEALSIPLEELEATAPPEPERPGSAGFPGEDSTPPLPLSTLHALATAVAAADEIRAAADETVPLLEPTEAGRSKLPLDDCCCCSPGRIRGMVEVCLDFRFLGSLSFLDFGCC